jgi:Tol biopolymer transport system component
VSLTTVFLALLSGLSFLEGQERVGTELPVIETGLTSIIDSDTLQIRQAALSPDGRWVVYSALSPGGEHLWVIPVEGGKPSLLVGEKGASRPAWFPGGERIAYHSDGINGIMTVPFDGDRGQVSGPPRRITLDPVPFWPSNFRISPDGRWIAYKSWPAGGQMLVKVISSNGGNARTIASERTNRVFLQDWSEDGRYVYYRRRDYDAPDSYLIFRADVNGEGVEPVTEMPTGASRPDFPYRVSRVATDGADEPGYEVQTLLEDPVARLKLPLNASTGDPGELFAHGGSKLLAVVSKAVRPLRILPVEGGPPVQLGEAKGLKKPLGWAPDGSEVYFSWTEEGRTTLLAADVDGGSVRELGPMPDLGPPVRDYWGNPIIFSPDGEYLSYSKPTPDSRFRTFVIRPTAGGQDRIVTDSLLHHEAFGLAGPGGSPVVAGEEFLYTEWKGGGHYEIRAVSPTGLSRLIRSGVTGEAPFCYGVFEDRVVCAGRAEESTSTAPVSLLWVADGSDGPMKEIASLPGVVAFDDIVWSNDGKWIAANSYNTGGPETGGMKVVVVGVDEKGKVTTPYRVIDTPMYGSAWSLRWLPDDSAVILYGQSLPDWGFDIWLIPVKNGGRPVALTRDETDGVGYHVLSPDGRFIAYDAGVRGGTSLWLADLGDALKR